MATWANTAEGQAHNTVPQSTPSNNTGGGSGDQFTNIGISGSAAMIFSTSDAARGTTCYEITGTTGLADGQVRSLGAVATIATQFFYKYTGNPSGTSSVTQFRTSGGTLLCGLSLTTTGRLVAVIGTGASVVAATNVAGHAISTNTWLLINARFTVGTGATDRIEFDVYVDGTWTPIISYDSGAALDFSSDTGIDRSYLGKSATTSLNGATWRYDDARLEYPSAGMIALPVTEVTGTGVAVLGALTGTAAGVPSTLGAISTVLGGLTGTGSGQRTTFGTGSGTIGGLTGTAAGVRSTTGTAAGTLGPLTGSAAGVPTTFGVAAIVLGGLVGAASGESTGGGPVEGTAVIILGALTGTATGVPTTKGTAAGTLGGLTGTGSGVRTRHGTAIAVIGGLTGTAAGRPTTFGTATGQLGPLTGVAAGRPTVHGTGTTTLGGLIGVVVLDVILVIGQVRRYRQPGPTRYAEPSPVKYREPSIRGGQ